MVVDNLDIYGSSLGPDEADPVLVVDADAVLPGACAFQRLQSIAGRHPQVVETTGDLQLAQLASGDRLNRLQTPHPSPACKRLGVGGLERDDHTVIVTLSVINVKREYTETVRCPGLTSGR